LILLQGNEKRRMKQFKKNKLLKIID